jgi:hypothetical protein
VCCGKCRQQRHKFSFASDWQQGDGCPCCWMHSTDADSVETKGADASRSAFTEITGAIVARYALFRSPDVRGGGTELVPSEIEQIIHDGVLAAGFKVVRRQSEDCQLDPEGHHRWQPLGDSQHCQACGDVSEPLKPAGGEGDHGE